MKNRKVSDSNCKYTTTSPRDKCVQKKKLPCTGLSTQQPFGGGYTCPTGHASGTNINDTVSIAHCLPSAKCTPHFVDML